MTSRHNFTKCKDMFSAKNFTVYWYFFLPFYFV